MLANGALDEVTVAAFLAFVNDNLEGLVHPEDLLDAKDFEPIGARIAELAGGTGDSKRVDRLATICTRLYLYLAQEGYRVGSQHKSNLVKFLLHKDLPNDLRFSLHKDITALGTDHAALLRDKTLAATILEGM